MAIIFSVVPSSTWYFFLLLFICSAPHEIARSFIFLHFLISTKNLAFDILSFQSEMSIYQRCHAVIKAGVFLNLRLTDKQLQLCHR